MRENRRAASTLLIVAGLVSIAVLYVLSGMGAENDQKEAAEPSAAVTDTAAAAGSDGDTTPGAPVTDTTTAPARDDPATRNTTSTTTSTTPVLTTTAPAPEDSATRSTTSTTSAPTTTTQPASTTTAVYVSLFERRASHPAWDDRLPSTRKGLKGTGCHGTFQYKMIFTPLHSTSFRTLFGVYESAHDKVIAMALQDPTWEPTPGTALHDALANLGVSSAQDIRDMGDEVEVRWYAWWVRRMINRNGDPTHPACASILAGANAVLTPYQTTTTTTTP